MDEKEMQEQFNKCEELLRRNHEIVIKEFEYSFDNSGKINTLMISLTSLAEAFRLLLLKCNCCDKHIATKLEIAEYWIQNLNEEQEKEYQKVMKDEN